jgi:hypothetical protein
MSVNWGSGLRVLEVPGVTGAAHRHRPAAAAHAGTNRLPMPDIPAEVGYQARDWIAVSAMV